MWLGAMLSDSEENITKQVQYYFHYTSSQFPKHMINLSIPAKLLKSLWIKYAD